MIYAKVFDWLIEKINVTLDIKKISGKKGL